MVVLMQFINASFLLLKHSGPFSAMNNAIWSPSLWQTKLSRFVKMLTNVVLPATSFSFRHGSMATVNSFIQSMAVVRLRQYLMDEKILTNRIQCMDVSITHLTYWTLYPNHHSVVLHRFLSVTSQSRPDSSDTLWTLRLHFRLW